MFPEADAKIYDEVGNQCNDNCGDIDGDGIVKSKNEEGGKLGDNEVKYFMNIFRSQMQAFSQRQWSIT